MGHVCLLESETHRSDKSFMLWRFSSEVLSDKADLIDSSFPAFFLSFSWADHIEHLSFSHRFYFFNRDRPLTSFFFSFLFDHIGQYLWILLLFPIHKISRDGSLLDLVISAFSIFLFVLFDGFFHLYFLFKPFFIEQFSFNTFEGLCFFGDNFWFSSLFLSSLLFCIKSFSVPLLMEIHVIILRHGFSPLLKL